MVTRGRIEQLAAGFARIWQRPPTAAELGGLIEDHIREEVFYRGALEMGLERDDIIVRRRLRQKMEFLAEEIGADAQPTDAELQAFMTERGDSFRLESRIAFSQIFFRSEGGREAAAAAAERLARLPDDAAAAAIPALGDPSLLPPDFGLAPVSEAAEVFGDSFADSLVALDLNRWGGPLESELRLAPGAGDRARRGADAVARGVAQGGAGRMDRRAPARDAGRDLSPLARAVRGRRRASVAGRRRRGEDGRDSGGRIAMTPARTLLVVVVLALVPCGLLHAHEVRPGYLELRQQDAERLPRAVEGAGARRDLRLAVVPAAASGCVHASTRR